jgi:predicted naringenin-chalcone synthase
MNPSILALSNAVPPYAFSQEEILEKIIKDLPLDEQMNTSLRQLYKNSAIRTRYLVTDDFKKERSDWDFWGAHYPLRAPGMSKRNELYKKEAPKLALEVAKKALEKWGGDPSQITHIISVSCTGVVAPGIEFQLIQELNLNWSVNRLGINFMGCFGAFKGLSVANAFAKENPEHRILLICTELCSLHLQHDASPDNILANSLFADGAAAAIIGAHPQKNEKPLWTIHKTHSLGMKNSLDKMSWEAGDHGYFMKLSARVPVLLGREIAAFTASLLGPDISSSDCDWAIHPGGKSIIHAMEKAMQLKKQQTLASWDILANYGNMSSATFLFVLDSLAKQKERHPWTMGIGFGPGLSFEGILLQNRVSYA